MPCTNCPSCRAARASVSICGPPPCTTTGFMPTSLSSTTSRAKSALSDVVGHGVAAELDDDGPAVEALDVGQRLGEDARLLRRRGVVVGRCVHDRPILQNLAADMMGSERIASSPPCRLISAPRSKACGPTCCATPRCSCGARRPRRTRSRKRCSRRSPASRISPGAPTCAPGSPASSSTRSSTPSGARAGSGRWRQPMRTAIPPSSTRCSTTPATGPSRPIRWEQPEGALEQKQFLAALEQCLRDLPERTAQAFMMREHLGLETAEICKELAITPTHLWVMLYRARMALRRVPGNELVQQMMLSCKETSRLLSQAKTAGSASASGCALRVHLAICDGCRNAAAAVPLPAPCDENPLPGWRRRKIRLSPAAPAAARRSPAACRRASEPLLVRRSLPPLEPVVPGRGCLCEHCLAAELELAAALAAERGEQARRTEREQQQAERRDGADDHRPEGRSAASEAARPST